MKKKIINTAVFFTILYWILAYFLVFKHKILIKEVNLVSILILILINGVIIMCSRFLLPVFELVLKGTQKIGTLIFGLITTLVYFLILTPIALFKRVTGKTLMQVAFEKDKDSYYQDWEPAGNIEKQY